MSLSFSSEYKTDMKLSKGESRKEHSLHWWEEEILCLEHSHFHT